MALMPAQQVRPGRMLLPGRRRRVHGLQPGVTEHPRKTLGLRSSSMSEDSRGSSGRTAPAASSTFPHIRAWKRGDADQIVDDPRAAARGLTRACGPAGGSWRRSGRRLRRPRLDVGEVLDAAGAVRPELPRLSSDMDFERTTEGLAGVLRDAGLEPVDSAVPAWEWRVAPDDLWAGMTAVGTSASPGVHKEPTCRPG